MGHVSLTAAQIKLFRTIKFNLRAQKWDLLSIFCKKNKAKILVNILLKLFAFALSTPLDYK